MPSNELKRAARAYAAAHGVKYTEALRAITAERPPVLVPVAAAWCEPGCDGTPHPGASCYTWNPFDLSGQPVGEFDVCQAASLPNYRAESLADRFFDQVLPEWSRRVLKLVYAMLLEEQPELIPEPRALRTAVEAGDLAGVDQLMRPLDQAAAELLDPDVDHWTTTTQPRLAAFAERILDTEVSIVDQTMVNRQRIARELAKQWQQARAMRPNSDGYMEHSEWINWREITPALTAVLRASRDEAGQPRERIRAQVTVTANSDGTASPRRWEIVVDDPRQEEPFAEWIHPNHERPRVDELADVHGWRRAAGVEWPVEPTSEPVTVELERSEVGQRVDEVEKILAAAGVTWHEACEPYIAAVAHELERAGIGVKEGFAAGNEPRDGAIDLTSPEPDYSTQMAWREDRGWSYASFRRGQNNGKVIDLPVGHLAEPYDVVVAFCEVIDHPVRTERPDWRPPADYDTDAVAPAEWWDVSPALERALTCYTTYPGWTPADPAPTPAPEPVRPRPPRGTFDRTAYDVAIIDPVTGCWRAWSRAKDTVVRPVPELADDGEMLYGDVRIAEEVFSNLDGALPVRTGRADVSTWLANRAAPTGSKHDDTHECRVCHDHYNYEIPATLETLEHRGHQIRAAYERLTGLAPGDGAQVLAEQDGDVLALTLRLTNPATRLLGLHWRSDSDDWKTIVQTEESPTERMFGTLLGQAEWQPLYLANEMQRYVSQYR